MPSFRICTRVYQEQIDAIVAKAVDKALAERQAKIDAAADKKVDVITNPQTTAATPDMAIPFGLKFSGYARYGAQFQTGDQKFVGVDGSYNGASAIGRLGNEGNGGEFQITKAFKSSKGAIWDINVMFDHWSDEVNLKKPTSALPTCWSLTPTPISGPAATSISARNRGLTTTSG